MKKLSLHLKINKSTQTQYRENQIVDHTEASGLQVKGHESYCCRSLRQVLCKILRSKIKSVWNTKYVQWIAFEKGDENRDDISQIELTLLEKGKERKSMSHHL